MATIHRDTKYLVITDYNHSYWGPAGSIISQHRSYSAAKRATDKTCGFGHPISVKAIYASDDDYWAGKCIDLSKGLKDVEILRHTGLGYYIPCDTAAEFI